MEKILEKSGKSQGILSVRKSGNPANLFVPVCCRNIKRIVFYSLKKLTGLADGGVKVDLIDPSQALQISGRAGKNK